METFDFEGTNVSVDCARQGAHTPHWVAEEDGTFCLGHAGPLPGSVEELVIVVERFESGAPGYPDCASGYHFTRSFTGGQTLYVCEDDPPRP